MCKEMGWDYYTYLNQPDWFVETLRIIGSIDYDYNKSNEK